MLILRWIRNVEVFLFPGALNYVPWTFVMASKARISQLVHVHMRYQCAEVSSPLSEMVCSHRWPELLDKSLVMSNFDCLSWVLGEASSYVCHNKKKEKSLGIKAYQWDHPDGTLGFLHSALSPLPTVWLICHNSEKKLLKRLILLANKIFV
jgi:hypothetical protein